MNDETHEKPIDLRNLLRVVRRRYAVILLFAVLVPAAALAYSLAADEQYTAKSTLLFRDPQLDQKLFGSSFVQESQDDARRAATNLELVSLDVVAARTARAVGQGYTRDAVQRQVHVAAEGQADVVSVEATDRDPRTAAKLANAFAQEYIGFRRRADRAKVSEARELVQRQLDRIPLADQDSPNARSLAQRLQELEILAALQTGNAEQVQIAEVPDSPSSPKTRRNVVVGALLGFLLGVAAALLVERLDRRLRTPDQLRDIFGRPILAVVPATDELVDPERPLPLGAAEAFRMLRANLRYFNVDEEIRSVLVTSPQPGDGKSTVAWNLSSAASASGLRTLLVEADLRRPSLGRWMHVAPRLGLSGVLSHQGSAREATIHVPFGEANGSGPTHTLDVILSGPLPPNPDELLESERMREVIQEAEKDYDLVVIDTPPTSIVSDAIPLVKEVSGVLVVGRVDKTMRDSASQLAQQLANLGGRVLGVVVNHVRPGRGGYGYGYGYGVGHDRLWADPDGSSSAAGGVSAEKQPR
jgi:polysaccharide biosynthesis transport protein